MNLDELDALWAERHLESQREEFDRALGAALDQEPRQPELLWRRARSQHFRGMLGEDRMHRRETGPLFADGQRYVRRALKIEAANVGGLFWAAACSLEAARMRGPLAAVRALRPARRWLEKAAELDAGFHYAGPLRVLGRMAHLTPQWLGGDKGEAVLLYGRALKLSPGHPTTMLYLAETFLSQGRREEACEVLEEVVAAAPFTGWIWEQERDRGRARLLLEELGVQ